MCTFVSTHGCIALTAKCLLDFASPGSNFCLLRILSSLTFSGFDFTSIYRSTVWRDVCFLWSTSYGMNFMVLYLCYKFKNRKTVNHIWHASRLNLILDTMFASELHLAYFMVPSLCLLLILDVLSHYWIYICASLFTIGDLALWAEVDKGMIQPRPTDF
jgi:hypothetical protein